MAKLKIPKSKAQLNAERKEARFRRINEELREALAEGLGTEGAIKRALAKKYKMHLSTLYRNLGRLSVSTEG